MLNVSEALVKVMVPAMQFLERLLSGFGLSMRYKPVR
jgi:hypothetical protein